MKLLKEIKEELTDSYLNRLSNVLELSPHDTISALDVFLPGILGGIAIKGAKIKGSKKILDSIDKNDFDIENIFLNNDKLQDFLDYGSDRASLLFGNKKSELAGLLCEKIDLNKSTGEKTLNFLTPIVLEKVVVFAKSNNLDNQGLSKFFAAQIEGLSVLTPGIESLLSKPKTEPKIHSIEGFNKLTDKPKKKWWKRILP